ncbi:hypothetical protein [Schlesneria sp. T3-172]|uniref:hypothetical protein n=1 Tax=Schlesneria sphaerica TaxID=3373610 RepID=UPI0037C9360E
MAGWLSRTTSLFQKKPQSQPEPFEVECDCGGKVTGQRTPTFQKPLCPVCERPVFVLPANVYPRPVVRAKSKALTPRSTQETKGGRTSPNLVIDEAGSSTSTAASSSKGGSKKGGRRDRKVGTPETPEPLLPQEPRSPLVTPLRLIGVAIVLISGLTATGLWYRQQFEAAKATAATAAEAGLTALKNGEFALAAVELKKAQQAVDLLKRKDPEAENIRRRSQEATTLANLASSSLIDILEAAIASAKPGQSDPLHMASLDQDAWVVFDSHLLPAAEGASRVMLDAPMRIDGVTVRIEIDSAVLKRAMEAEEAAERPRVIFAAQLEQISPPKGDPPVSVLQLNSRSAYLWTNYDAYLALGYQPLETEKDQIQALFDRQQQIR